MRVVESRVRSRTGAASTRKKKDTNALAGWRVLVSRAKEQAGILSEGLREHGAQVLEVPFIEIRNPRSFKPLDNGIKLASEYEWLILTSVNGVRAFFDRLSYLGFSRGALRNLKIAAIGPATRAAIEKHGLTVEVTPREYVAEAVVEALHGKVKNTRVMLVRAKVARDVIPRELKAMGAYVDVIEAYETVVPRKSRDLLRSVLSDPDRRPHAITFTSSSTVRNFVDLLGRRVALGCLQNGIRSASIGPVTSDTLREFGLPVHIQAEHYTVPGLVDALVVAAKLSPIDPYANC